MSIRGDFEKTQIDNNTHIAEYLDPLPDRRLKTIYERYHDGKSIIMDDLKYLCLKDPDGCKKLIRSIVDPNAVQDLELESNHILNVYEEKITEKTEKVISYIESKSDSDLPMDIVEYVMDTQENVIETQNYMNETMISVKSEIDKMSELELMDMLKNLNEALELKKMSNTMKFWDDTFADKMVMYTYGEEKEFNMLT